MADDAAGAPEPVHRVVGAGPRAGGRAAGPTWRSARPRRGRGGSLAGWLPDRADRVSDPTAVLRLCQFVSAGVLRRRPLASSVQSAWPLADGQAYARAPDPLRQPGSA